MTDPLRRHWRGLAIAGAGVVAGLVGYNTLYAAPAAALRARTTSGLDTAQSYNSAADRDAEVRERLRAVAATTLGRDADLVRHRLRTMLADLAEASGLDGVEVSERGPESVPSPTARAGVHGALGKQLRSRADFGLFHAEVVGTGTLEACLGTLAGVQAQPWAHRVRSFSIRPEDAQRTRFTLRIAVSTLYVPDLAGDDPPDPAAPNIEGVLALAGTSPIRPPDPAAPPPPAPTSPTTAAGPAWNAWRLTGVIESASGVEVMLTRTDGGDWRTIHPGESILDAELVEASGERAVFLIDESRWVVSAGRTLAERVPADSVH